MEIEPSDWKGGVTLHDVVCARHLSPATHFLSLYGAIIPLCDECLSDLKDELNRYCAENSSDDKNA